MAGDDRRSAAVTFFEDLEEVATGGVERLKPRRAPAGFGVAAVAAGEREVGKQTGMRW
jgi:hypothetical protein